MPKIAFEPPGPPGSSWWLSGACLVWVFPGACLALGGRRRPQKAPRIPQEAPRGRRRPQEASESRRRPQEAARATPRDKGWSARATPRDKGLGFRVLCFSY